MNAFPQAERGFALVAALWSVLVLSAIVASVTLTSRTEARLSRNHRELVEMDAVDSAGINAVILQLVNGHWDGALPLDGTPITMDFGNHSVRLSVQDEAGKIDLNRAPGEILVRLLSAAGLDAISAGALADKIMDWREPGAGKRLNGAKKDDYRAAGYVYAPRGAPLESVEELRLVMGMTSDLFERIAPLVTVYAQTPAIDPEVAPDAVLSLLPGIDEDRITRIIEQRQNRALGPASVASLAASGQTTLNGRSFEIIADVEGHDLIRIKHTAVIRVTGLQTSPFWVYRWQ